MDEQEIRLLLTQLLMPIVQFNEYEIELALDLFSFKTFESEAHVFVSQDIVTEVHFVLSGLGRYYYLDRDGKEFNKSLVKQGGAFTSIGSLVDSSPSPFYAQALTQCKIASIRYDELVALAEDNPNWGRFVRRLYERLALKKERREASFLLLDAQQRYEQFLMDFGSESENIALNQVAMYLGITDVSLSRIRKKMGLT
ncbi:Crp/Fnr family transcriptional regulator [Pseudoalteromonas obscura]|uniref:Crp/Fnr family transcriptional regulator n=1 Tax=Pseudoalteromonas obscura TaxID=3048491 RepID=A0ABT7EGJ0_9GAMM|nr:Crp/Fnr family transcriptional regulator [Pseudoalteromonas sp. P94(2023)]MDK2594144.1 Crp/Fnr family transcriptional regulator [Pseudoalteromonas sp. P94(2023)]